MEQVAPIAGRLLAALQFFTRLPLPAALSRHADHDAPLSRAAPVFGLAGLVIGLVVALVWLVAASLLPAGVAAGMAIGAGMLLTGALHEDGLADCADGLGAPRSREAALAIMRDSRVGTFGVIALVLSVGLRWAALASLAVGAGALALIIAHALARAAITPALRFSTYVRPQGAGSLVADGISTNELATALGVALVIALVCGGLGGVVAALAGLGAALVALLAFERRIGGYTGDALGGMEQIAEIAVLVMLAGMWSL
ncbi:MAG: adenosylcobinamide-GDP ribazoletransferase [Alphaproteobacteria bacterium]|nr:MAG: adenosylcobinamide-GDP ribazoletransferase [Alphaproteobacteria bacterium]